MRSCRKCGETIPAKIVVDGKQKNLQNRKFCLGCSSWRGHNTKTDDPAKESRKGGYSQWSDSEKRKNIDSLLCRGTKRKQELILMSGGGCSVCGYKKCSRALTFHHRDPQDKKFSLTKNNLWSKTWDVILGEYAKCDLLCMNCHAEVEDYLQVNKRL